MEYGSLVGKILSLAVVLYSVMATRQLVVAAMAVISIVMITIPVDTVLIKITIS